MNEQLGLADLDDEEQQLAEYIIGNIDDDGYLRRDLMAISDDLAFNMNLDVPEEKLEKILLAIQEFDPPGIAARDLRECLLLQLTGKRARILIWQKPSSKIFSRSLQKSTTIKSEPNWSFRMRN